MSETTVNDKDTDAIERRWVEDDTAEAAATEDSATEPDEIEDTETEAAEAPEPGTAETPEPGTAEAPEPGTAEAPAPGVAEAEPAEPETAETEPAGTELASTEPASTEPKRAASWLRAKVLVPGAAFLVVLAAAVFFAVGYFQANSAESDRTEALQAGNRIMKSLGDFDYQDINKNIEAVTADASDGFRPQYKNLVNQLRGKVQELKAKSTMDIVASGVTRVQGDKADLVFLSNQTVTNAQHKEPVVQPWRTQVTLVRQDGSWKLDGMTFV
ncbi:hypothetical protein [Sciscionella sediminilitoris]|uniref:hypothetical protein n=1 Tax=Sciscionella sediminilitoris TaxID=1445613 RepID=UPI0004DEE3C8|nr:hypothetical protein [Sciscionella sp. SE31]